MQTFWLGFAESQRSPENKAQKIENNFRERTFSNKFEAEI